MKKPCNRVVTSCLGALLLSLSGCADSGANGAGFDPTEPVHVDLDAAPPTHLSEYNLFAWNPAEGFTFHPDAIPYDLNTPLFSDYALKSRAVYVPAGASVAYTDDGVFSFPVGTVIVKSFYFPADFREPTRDLRLIETRVLVHHADGWRAWPYVWDAAQHEATLQVAGDVRAVSFVDATGAAQTASYLVPQRNQCQTCHERKESADARAVITPIGPSARNLNREHDYGGDVGVRNQLTHMAERGALTGLPAGGIDAAYDFAQVERSGPSALAPADLDRAARDYLDVNCAHCHNPNGVQGITSQLFLNHSNTDRFHLGVCKRPGSAGAGTGGREHDIVPGDPDRSILVFRVETTEPGAMMPLLGRSLRHANGAALLRAWIAAMPAESCGP